MRCPVCHVGLIATDLANHGLAPVHRCPQCNGTWFDPECISALDDQLWTQVEEVGAGTEPREPLLKCPGCTAALSAHAPQDARRVTVQRCLACGGLWIGRQELEHVVVLGEDEHSKVFDRKSMGSRPANWSRLRWVAYRLRRCFE